MLNTSSVSIGAFLPFGPYPDLKCSKRSFINFCSTTEKDQLPVDTTDTFKNGSSNHAYTAIPLYIPKAQTFPI